jgi:hypothetical protein
MYNLEFNSTSKGRLKVLIGSNKNIQRKRYFYFYFIKCSKLFLTTFSVTISQNIIFQKMTSANIARKRWKSMKSFIIFPKTGEQIVIILQI